MFRTGSGPDDFVRSGDPIRKGKTQEDLAKAISDRGLRKEVRDLGLERMMNRIEQRRNDQLPKNIEKKADGGVAGLSDQARDMFKGPKGIGSYESFMVG